MTSKATVKEQICGVEVRSEIESYTTDGKCRVKLVSSCSKVSPFAEKLEKLELDRLQVYNLGLYDLWLVARSCGLKPYCPIPTAIINAIWLENGMIAESLASRSITKMFLDPSDKTKTRIKIEQPLCGYIAFVKANSISPQKIEITIVTPCAKVRRYLKREVEIKPFRSFEDCERVFKQAKNITPTCFIPVAVSIAFALETQVIKIEEVKKPILEVSFSRA